MDYKSLKTNIKNNSDIYLVGVFTDMKLQYLGKSVSQSNVKHAKNCFDKNNFTGEIGDHRTIDDFENNSQILFFGLGKKEKYSPIALSLSLIHI